MNLCNKCLKEGNPIVEALGNGIQAIMIKTTKPSPVGKQFVFFPTSLYNHVNINETFKEQYQDFAQQNQEVARVNNKNVIKYYASVEYVIEDAKIPLKYFDDFHIWEEDYLKDFLGKKSVYIWLLRVYQLKENFPAPMVKGGMYGNLKKGISVDFMRPVISDDDFTKIKQKLISIEYDYYNNDETIITKRLNTIIDSQEKILEQVNRIDENLVFRDRKYSNQLFKTINNQYNSINNRRHK